MFVKSVIIDGFKSYGNRVEINGFDPQFNAITGLNGTGKSNILDAICFVLGISNLSQVGKLYTSDTAITCHIHPASSCMLLQYLSTRFADTGYMFLGSSNIFDRFGVQKWSGRN